MDLKEANERLKKPITEDQLWKITPLYILLDLHKDDFCKIVNAVGHETLLKKQSHYEWLRVAEEELEAKERYLQAKERLAELEIEKSRLESVVNNFKHI